MIKFLRLVGGSGLSPSQLVRIRPQYLRFDVRFVDNSPLVGIHTLPPINMEPDRGSPKKQRHSGACQVSCCIIGGTVFLLLVDLFRHNWSRSCPHEDPAGDAGPGANATKRGGDQHLPLAPRTKRASFEGVGKCTLHAGFTLKP